MAITKAKKAPAKKAVTKKPAAKKSVARKAATSKKTVRSTATSRRKLITRSDEFTQVTWLLFSVWLILIIVFLGTVISKTS